MPVPTPPRAPPASTSTSASPAALQQPRRHFDGSFEPLRELRAILWARVNDTPTRRSSAGDMRWSGSDSSRKDPASQPMLRQWWSSSSSSSGGNSSSPLLRRKHGNVDAAELGDTRSSSSSSDGGDGRRGQLIDQRAPPSQSLPRCGGFDRRRPVHDPPAQSESGHQQSGSRPEHAETLKVTEVATAHPCSPKFSPTKPPELPLPPLPAESGASLGSEELKKIQPDGVPFHAALTLLPRGSNQRSSTLYAAESSPAHSRASSSDQSSHFNPAVAWPGRGHKARSGAASTSSSIDAFSDSRQRDSSVRFYRDSFISLYAAAAMSCEASSNGSSSAARAIASSAISPNSTTANHQKTSSQSTTASSRRSLADFDEMVELANEAEAGAADDDGQTSQGDEAAFVPPKSLASEEEIDEDTTFTFFKSEGGAADRRDTAPLLEHLSFLEWQDRLAALETPRKLGLRARRAFVRPEPEAIGARKHIYWEEEPSSSDEEAFDLGLDHQQNANRRPSSPSLSAYPSTTSMSSFGFGRRESNMTDDSQYSARSEKSSPPPNMAVCLEELEDLDHLDGIGGGLDSTPEEVTTMPQKRDDNQRTVHQRSALPRQLLLPKHYMERQTLSRKSSLPLPSSSTVTASKADATGPAHRPSNIRRPSAPASVTASRHAVSLDDYRIRDPPKPSVYAPSKLPTSLPSTSRPSVRDRPVAGAESSPAGRSCMRQTSASINTILPARRLVELNTAYEEVTVPRGMFLLQAGRSENRRAALIFQEGPPNPSPGITRAVTYPACVALHQPLAFSGTRKQPSHQENGCCQ